VYGQRPSFVIPSGCEKSTRSDEVFSVRAIQSYWVYILTNRTGTLYVGVTNNLPRRIHEHQNRLVPGFTSRYAIGRLVYAEEANDAAAAIAREKQIKAWRRSRKVALIESLNPKWRDLSLDW
jgi:putative endonuclease